MRDNILKVGIAGYGTVGKIRHHYIDNHPNMEVVAICDKFLHNIKDKKNKIEYFSNYKDLLASIKIDALFVCLPNYLACEVTIAAIKKDIHVFCEKPPGKDVEDIIKVREHERKNKNIKVMYGFNHRYHDSVMKAIDLIKSKILGNIISLKGVYGKSKIIKFDSDWRTKRMYSGGGILLDQGIHMVDMMRLFAGEFVDFHSFISNDYWKHDVEDNAYALMKTKTGIVAMLHSSATQWSHTFSLSISLTKGAIVLSGILSSTKATLLKK